MPRLVERGTNACPVPGSRVAVVTGDSMPVATDEGAGGAGALFVTKKQGCAQDSSFERAHLQSAHRTHSLSLEKADRKAISLSILCLFHWPLFWR